MKKGLELLLASTLAAVTAISGCSPDKSKFDEFASAYKTNKLAQYTYQTSPTPENKAAYSGKGGTLDKFNKIKINQYVYDKEQHFRDQGILCFETPKINSSYVAPIVGEPKIVDGYKVYHTRSNSKDLPHSVGLLRSHKTGNSYSTIFTDLDGKTAVMLDLHAVVDPHMNLEDVWDEKVVKNHKYFVNGDKRWDPATEATYLVFQNTQKDQIEEESIRQAKAGTTAHEVQHAKDKDAGLLRKLPRYKFEVRGHIKGLIEDPSGLYRIIKNASIDIKNEDNREAKAISNEIIKGLFQIHGVRTYEEFFEKVKTPEDISRSAELLWNIKNIQIE